MGCEASIRCSVILAQHTTVRSMTTPCAQCQYDHARAQQTSEGKGYRLESGSGLGSAFARRVGV